MNTEGRSSERGQALVLIVLAIVAMFGFAALAVDLGRVYAERRRAQNAADAAAYAAAYAGATAANDADRQAAAEDAAIKQLDLNGFVDPNNINTYRTDPEQTVDATVQYQAGSAGSPSYYTVTIDARVDQVFSQFVYRGPLRVTVTAVVEASSGTGMYVGDALHATTPTGCKGLWFTGTGNVKITGGDAYADSDRDPAGVCGPSNTTAQSCDSGIKEGSGTITIDAGHTISTHGDFDIGGNAGKFYTVDQNGITTEVTDPSTIVKQCQPPKKVDSMPAPHCDPTVRTVPRTPPNPLTLYPGTYTDGLVNSKNITINLMPGLYCITGNKGLSINGGNFTGYGVMFYVQNGDVDITGNTTVTMTSAGSSVPPAVPSWGKDPGNVDFEWGGMLIYMPTSNTGQIHLGGTSGSNYSGTIYAPGDPPNGADKCVLEGNSTGINENINFTSSVICNTIKIAGKATVNITYDEKKNFHFPPSLSTSQ